MMLYTGLDIGEHQPWKGYGLGRLKPGFFWKNSSKDILKFFALLGIKFF